IGTDKSNDVVLEYGRNILSCEIVEDFTTPINRAIVLGEATDANELQRIEVDDETLQDEYKVREGLLTEMDVSEIDTMEDKGYAMINKYEMTLIKISHDLLPNSPNISQFREGDVIRLIIRNGLYNINEE